MQTSESQARVRRCGLEKGLVLSPPSPLPLSFFNMGNAIKD